MEIQNASTGEVKVGRTGVEIGTGAEPNMHHISEQYVGGRTEARTFRPGASFWTPTGPNYSDSDISKGIR